MNTRKRQPAGIPVGGEFARTVTDEAEVSFSSDYRGVSEHYSDGTLVWQRETKVLDNDVDEGLVSNAAALGFGKAVSRRVNNPQSYETARITDSYDTVEEYNSTQTFLVDPVGQSGSHDERVAAIRRIYGDKFGEPQAYFQAMQSIPKREIGGTIQDSMPEKVGSFDRDRVASVVSTAVIITPGIKSVGFGRSGTPIMQITTDSYEGADNVVAALESLGEDVKLRIVELDGFNANPAHAGSAASDFTVIVEWS